LNYGNIYEFGASIKNFTWKIISIDDWKEYELSQNESEKLSEDIIYKSQG
jgi:hypothetical protein